MNTEVRKVIIPAILTVCRLGRYFIAVNFGASAARVARPGSNIAVSHVLQPWHVGVWRNENRLF